MLPLDTDTGHSALCLIIQPLSGSIWQGIRTVVKSLVYHGCYLIKRYHLPLVCAEQRKHSMLGDKVTSRKIG